MDVSPTKFNLFYFYCSGTLWATCYNSSSTRPLVRQPDIRDLCIPAPSTSLKKRERRSGKYWQRCATLCWYACSFSFCWTTVVLISMKIFSFLLNVILIFSWMCESNGSGLNPNQIKILWSARSFRKNTMYLIQFFFINFLLSTGNCLYSKRYGKSELPRITWNQKMKKIFWKLSMKRARARDAINHWTTMSVKTKFLFPITSRQVMRIKKSFSYWIIRWSH